MDMDYRTFNSEFEYHRLKLSIEHNIRLGILGSTQYNFEGEIIGNVPFPLLEVHPEMNMVL